jgi:hypothetical protein
MHHPRLCPQPHHPQSGPASSQTAQAGPTRPAISQPRRGQGASRKSLRALAPRALPMAASSAATGMSASPARLPAAAISPL